jgi:hypothetical protein
MSVAVIGPDNRHVVERDAEAQAGQSVSSLMMGGPFNLIHGSRCHFLKSNSTPV